MISVALGSVLLTSDFYITVSYKQNSSNTNR